MHPRRLAALLLGGWLAGSVFMMLVATQSFPAIDRLLGSPSAPAAAIIQGLGEAQARALLRYHAAEQNRWYFESWEQAQLALGCLVLVAVVWGYPPGRRAALLPILMLAAVAVMHWFLTPELSRLERLIEFLPPLQPSPDRTRFNHFHLAYSTTETIKLILGVLLAARLLARRRRHAAAPPQGGSQRG